MNYEYVLIGISVLVVLLLGLGLKEAIHPKHPEIYDDEMEATDA